MDKIKYEVKVIPGSKINKVLEDDNKLKVYLKEKAEKGLANGALISVLEKHFKTSVKLVKGKTSRNKIVLVDRT